MSKISLFIPVYNCAWLITQDLRKSYNALLKLRDDFEITIVDDNSTDKSYRFKRLIDKAARGTGKDLKYVSFQKGPSRRENLARAFYAAKYDIICFIDADFSVDISYLLKAISVLKEKSADIVVGSRYIKGANAVRKPMRRLFSFFYNLIIRMVFNSGIKDHQCGLKVFRKEAVMPVIEDMGYDEKFIRGWFWDAELLIRAQKKNLKIIEIPVESLETSVSTFSFFREIKTLHAMIKLKRKLG